MPVSRAYQRLFVDLSALADHLAATVAAARMLEIGRRDGSFEAELTRAFPDAEYRAVDPDGAVDDLLGSDPAGFDLVCLIGVLHRVPAERRADLLHRAAELTAPDGHLAIEEHHRDGPVAPLTQVAHRLLYPHAPTRGYLSRAELVDLVRAVPDFGPTHCAPVPPLRGNVLLIRRRRTAQPARRSPAPLAAGPA